MPLSKVDETDLGETNSQTKMVGVHDGSDLSNLIIDYTSLKNNIEDNLYCKNCSTERRDCELDEFCMFSKQNKNIPTK